jgi:protease-4
MERRSALYALAVFGSLLGLCFLFLFLLFSSLDGREAGWGAGSGPKIGIVEIEGVIKGGDAREVVGKLHELRRDASIKALVVRVDSPGGAVAPSQEIHQAILRARKDKKVVCSMGTVAASGGYYVAAACDQIFASAGTITGSIGVISEVPHVQKLLDLARVDVDTIKSGAMKDIGSPLRAMSSDERHFLQGFVDNIYEQFLSDVAAARKLDKDKLRALADGRILTGKQAFEAGLVDKLGNFEDAVEAAARLAGEKGTPVPLFEKRGGRSLFGELFRDAAAELRARQSVEVRDPRL